MSSTRSLMVLGTAADPASLLVEFDNTKGPVWRGRVRNGAYDILYDHVLGQIRLLNNELLRSGVLIASYSVPDNMDYNDVFYECEQNLRKRGSSITRLLQCVWFACAPVVRRARALRYAFVAAGTTFAAVYRDPQSPNRVVQVERPDYDDDNDDLIPF